MSMEEKPQIMKRVKQLNHIEIHMAFLKDWEFHGTLVYDDNTLERFYFNKEYDLKNILELFPKI